MENIKFTLPWISSGDWITQGRKELKIERCNTLASKSHPRQKIINMIQAELLDANLMMHLPRYPYYSWLPGKANKACISQRRRLWEVSDCGSSHELVMMPVEHLDEDRTTSYMLENMKDNIGKMHVICVVQPTFVHEKRQSFIPNVV